MLVAVDLAEQENEEAKLDSLLETIPPGSMPASEVFKLAKTTEAEHEKNLSIAETNMESSLAEFYENCLQGEILTPVSSSGGGGGSSGGI